MAARTKPGEGQAWKICEERGYHDMTQVLVVSGADGDQRVFECETCGWRTDQPKPWEDD